MYCHDAAGKLTITYDYRIWANKLADFTLDMPGGGRMYFDNMLYEYDYYEKNGIKTQGMRYYLTEILREDSMGKMSWMFSFDQEGPRKKQFADHLVDWTKEVVLEDIP